MLRAEIGLRPRIAGVAGELLAGLRHRIFRFLVLATAAAALLTPLICLRTAPFAFVVSLRTSEAGVSEIYYDIGRGINARDSRAVPLYEGNSTLCFPLQSALYHSIRFDPIEHGYCDVTVGEVKIVDASGHVVRSFSPEDFADFHEISNLRKEKGRINFSLRAADKDPGFMIPIRPSLRLESSPEIYRSFALRTFLLCFGLVVLGAGAWLFFVRKGWQRAVFGAGILGLFVFVGARSRFYGPINFDEASFIWYGAIVNAGGIPYRDIFEPKGPVIFFANALGLSFFGLGNFHFRFVPTMVAAASIFLLYAALLKRHIVHWLALLVSMQVALWLLARDFHDTGLNDSETYGFAFTLIGLSLGSVAGSVRRPMSAMALQISGGIFLGVAVLTKELFVFSVVPVWLFLGFRQDDGRLDWRALALCATGVSLIAAAFLAYLLGHSALSGYFHELAFARTLAANYYVAIGRFPPVTGISVVSDSWRKLHEQLYNLDHLAFVLAVCGTAVVMHTAARSRVNLRRLGVAAGAVALGVVAISVGYCFWKHYFLMGATGLLLAAILAAEQVTSYLNTVGRRMGFFAAIVLVAALAFVGWTPTKSMLAESYSPRIASWDPIVTETIEQHSAPGDYVLAPGLPTILVALHRKNPYILAGPSDSILPYLTALPPQCRIESLREQLERHLPKVCYFPDWFRSEQRLCQQLIYQPVLAKHNYIKVNDNLWYLADSKQQ